MNRLPCSIGFVILSAGLGFAQFTGDQPRFEVASVKRTPPGDRIGSMDFGPMPPGPFNTGSHNPERITWTNIRLIRVLMMAYDLPGARISGPGWLDTEMYDIVAPVPKGTSVMDFKLMVRNLLAERVKLTLHFPRHRVQRYRHPPRNEWEWVSLSLSYSCWFRAVGRSPRTARDAPVPLPGAEAGASTRARAPAPLGFERDISLSQGDTHLNGFPAICEKDGHCLPKRWNWFAT